MSVPLHKLRDEARLLEDRIAAAEMDARIWRGVATTTADKSVASDALLRARDVERAARHMATRLSRIAQSIGGIL